MKVIGAIFLLRRSNGIACLVAEHVKQKRLKNQFRLFFIQIPFFIQFMFDLLKTEMKRVCEESMGFSS